MSTAARIDELRKKFEENPRRYFAPLANELRKAGNLSEAIALCREFLPKQPEHMSGYIVFGQALYESGDLSEARIVFEQALALDPENLKALRHLGDIAKWEGDTEGARRWYERVLEADPRNDDIAAQLATLVTPVYVTPVVPEPEPVSPTASAFFAPPTPAFPVPSVEVPPSYTPAFSMAPIGLGAIPTPDAALRAVDFDEINARLREPDAPQAESAGFADQATGAVPAPEPDLLDLDAIEAAGDAVRESTDALPDDPFGFSEAAVESLADDDVSFEEGLIAPDWPDTSELEARVATPRSVTPPFVASMTPDAVAAFGVEPGELIATTSFDEDALLTDIEAQLESTEERATDIAATFDVGAEPLNEIDVAAVEESAAEAAAVPVADVAADPVAEIAESRDEIDDAEPEWLVATPAVSTSSAEDELPWLAPAPYGEVDTDTGADTGTGTDSGAEAVGEFDVEATPEVEADFEVRVEAEAAEESRVADDAVAPFDAEVEAYVASEDASFADVMPEEHNTAFVTETMGELLVSQGFTARAVSVYEELVRRRPYDPVLTSRLAELQERVAAESAPVVPAHATPAFPTPAFPTPAVATPAFVSRVSPPFVTPLSATPLSVTPFSSPAYEESAFTEAPVDRVTARARFAELASRRVPRRTPPRATVAVETPADGLASLFGGVAPAHDDLAARALAEAFAPIDDETQFGGAIPFEEAMLGGVSRSPTPMRSATPIATAAVAEAVGGPFSFDRFFPDPATAASPLHTPPNSTAETPSDSPASAVARDVAPPTVSDDLAQFSAWLKGLGNT